MAVDGALRSGDIALIWGPPGTGKTRTLVEVVRQRVARGERVLCAAPSNTAVDNLGDPARRGRGKAIRMGHPARVSPALASTHDRRPDRRSDGATSSRASGATAPTRCARVRTASAAQRRGSCGRKHARSIAMPPARSRTPSV